MRRVSPHVKSECRPRVEVGPLQHRIAAGVLLEHEGRILLMRHRREGVYDFWVAPGGGVEGLEDLRAAARREVKEECGLDVEPTRIAYVAASADVGFADQAHFLRVFQSCIGVTARTFRNAIPS